MKLARMKIFLWCLFWLCSCRDSTINHAPEIILPLRSGAEAYLVDESGKRVSRSYREAHFNYMGGAVLTDQSSFLVFDQGVTYPFDRDASDRLEALGAHLTAGDVVIVDLVLGDTVLHEFYRRGKLALSSPAIALANDESDLLLIEVDGQWGLFHSGLTLVRNVPDREYVDISDGRWARYRSGSEWGYLDVWNDTVVEIEAVHASEIRDGLLIFRDHAGAFRLALIENEEIITHGPEYGGVGWISSDGLHAVVRDSASNQYGGIERTGRQVTPFHYDVLHIVGSNRILMRREEDEFWSIFSEGRISRTGLRSDTVVTDVGISGYLHFESTTRVGYIEEERDALTTIREILSVSKASPHAPSVIR